MSEWTISPADGAALASAVELLTRVVNNYACGDREAQALLESILRQHRTLQQSLWALLFRVIRLYGETASKDARNEGAVRVCGEIDRLMAESAQRKSWDALPCI